MTRATSRLLWIGWRVQARARRMLRRWLFAADAVIDGRATLIETARILNLSKRREAVSIGAESVVAGELLVFAHGGEIRIGEWCFIGEGTRIWSATEVRIGDRVLISHGVNIHDCDSHPRDARRRHDHFRSLQQAGHPRHLDGVAAAPVRIGDDAWIGFNSIILKGVSVGERSIVAAGSIVTRDVPPDSIHIGTTVSGPIQ